MRIFSMLALSTSLFCYTIPAGAVETQPWLGLLLLDAEDEQHQLLTLPAAQGRVILEHHWTAGDIPEVLATAGGVDGVILVAGEKFRITHPAGRFVISTDPETGEEVLDILARREDSTRRAHTVFENYIPDELINGRGFKPRRRYILEWWRKNLDYQPDSHWEISLQIHGWPDNEEESGRNPPLAIDEGTGVNTELVLRASPEATTRHLPNRHWDYAREEIVPDIGPNRSDVWEFWRMAFVLDPEGDHAMLKISRDGEVVHAEAGNPLGFNDARGQTIEIGIYKWYSADIVTQQRQCFIGPIRIQDLGIVSHNRKRRQPCSDGPGSHDLLSCQSWDSAPSPPTKGNG